MPVYRNRTGLTLVLSTYNLTIKPYEEFYTPYVLPEELIINGYLEKVSDDPINDIIPYTDYITMSPSQTVSISVKPYRKITIVFKNPPTNQDTHIRIYENYIHPSNKAIDLYWGQVFREDRLSAEKSYVNSYVIESPSINTENITIRIDYEL